ncbi:MAG: two-component sensor histidine kinase, partial [Pseudomonadota bacterium]
MRLVRLRRSTFARITFSYIVLLVSAILLLSAFVYWRVSSQMWSQLEQHVATEVESLAEQYQSDGLAGMVRVIDQRLARVPDRRSIYLLEDRFGQWVIGNINAWPTDTPDENGWLDFQIYDQSKQVLTNARVQIFKLSSGARLLVGRDTRDVLQTAALIKQVLAWGIAIVSILGCVLALVFSNRAGAKLRLLNQTSHRVIAGDLAVRVPVDETNCDLDELSVNINAMLEEINRLMRGIERVSDNIAHDLRTPLARVRNRISDVYAHSDDNMRDTLSNCLNDLDELNATFSSILRIARLENSDTSCFETYCDLFSVLENCVELYAPIAEEKALTLTIDAEPISLKGDEQLLNLRAGPARPQGAPRLH